MLYFIYIKKGIFDNIKMGLFGKNKKKGQEITQNNPPQLPKLPELPNSQSQANNSQRPISMRDVQRPTQLPSMPSNSLGDKFSKDSIKEAVSGRRGGEDYADDPNEMGQMMQEPLRKPMMKELDEEIEAEELGVGTQPNVKRRTRSVRRGEREVRTRVEAEPIFVRIDNFEEAISIFDETSQKLSEIEDLLGKIKHVRSEEEKELQSWEVNVKKLKQEIEKIDRDIFSKV